MANSKEGLQTLFHLQEYLPVFDMEKLFSAALFIGDLPTSAGVEHESSSSDSSITVGLDWLVFLSIAFTSGNGVFYRLVT